MTISSVKNFFGLVLLESIGSLFYLLYQPSNPSRSILWGYSYFRLMLLILVLIMASLIGSLFYKALRNPIWVEQVAKQTHEFKIIHTRFFELLDVLLILFGLFIGIYLFLFLIVSFNITTIATWVSIILFAGWVFLLREYFLSFHGKDMIRNWLTSLWNGWSTKQHQVFWILLTIALLYFIAFIPTNLQGANNSHEFSLHGGDEYVIYPVVVTMLTPQDTFSGTLYNLFIYEDYHYGYSFYLYSAFILLIPRLVFGTGFADHTDFVSIYGKGFADHTQLNLLLLRQFVSILPMILAIWLLVYLVTKNKSIWRSGGMFLMLLLLPGVVKYNQQFWHPDALLLLFIVLTFFFLRKDNFHFRRNFFFAAATCGLAIATKLFGFFFFLAVAGYLVAGVIKKFLSFRKMLIIGSVFIVVMCVVILQASPFLLLSSARGVMFNTIQEKKGEIAYGYDEPDPEKIYTTGLDSWMRFFELYYTERLFFYFLLSGLVLASLIGSEKYLSRLLLAWCLVVGIYLIYFVAVKSNQYMLPFMLPFYSGAFILPSILEKQNSTFLGRWLEKPPAHWIVWVITLVFCISQFAINLSKLYLP